MDTPTQKFIYISHLLETIVKCVRFFFLFKLLSSVSFVTSSFYLVAQNYNFYWSKQTFFQWSVWRWQKKNRIHEHLIQPSNAENSFLNFHHEPRESCTNKGKFLNQLQPYRHRCNMIRPNAYHTKNSLSMSFINVETIWNWPELSEWDREKCANIKTYTRQKNLHCQCKKRCINPNN